MTESAWDPEAPASARAWTISVPPTPVWTEYVVLAALFVTEMPMIMSPVTPPGKVSDDIVDPFQSGPDVVIFAMLNDSPAPGASVQATAAIRVEVVPAFNLMPAEKMLGSATTAAKIPTSRFVLVPTMLTIVMS
jgi:hypothetical protein